eukprot:TRINITY_DN19296_c0_g1_i1.p1 TRINITY_DN19296_c0_g1~~TRINITY_DN19296_c0_g1_i1.p1  ORF type:complete len:1099 (+),score=352.91 TRINITY_DN19296_c0_g1_i1:111-3407(+)
MGDCFSASQVEDPGQILRGNYPLQTLRDEQVQARQKLLISTGVFVEKFRNDGRTVRRRLLLEKDLTRVVIEPSKSVSSRYIPINDIIEIREASSAESVPNTELFARCEHTTVRTRRMAGRCAAIVFRASSPSIGRHCRSLCVAFDTCFVKDATVQCLGSLAAQARDNYGRDPGEARMRELWGRADRNRDQRLSRSEVSRLLQALNIQLTRGTLNSKFAAADIDSSSFLDYEEFRWFLQQLRKRKEVVPIFRKFAGGPRLGRRIPFTEAVKGTEVFLVPKSGSEPQLAVVVETGETRHVVRWRGLEDCRASTPTSGSAASAAAAAAAGRRRFSAPSNHEEISREWWDNPPADDAEVRGRSFRHCLEGGCARLVEWPIQVINGRGLALHAAQHWAGGYSMRNGGDGRGGRAWVRNDGQAFLFRGASGYWMVAPSPDPGATPLLISSVLNAPDPAAGGLWQRSHKRQEDRKAQDGQAFLGDECITAEDAIGGGGFRDFLQQCQNERVSLAIAEETIALMSGDTQMLSMEQFTNFLFNTAQNGWWKLHHKVRVYQQMDLPLTDYYVNSSHNTYLTGDQLKSRSSTEMYKICLEKGCRCVELDCWDGPDGQPIIYHGHTRTTKISFEAVCRVIAQYAFSTSEYPVVLSLEVHTCPEQQVRMAQIMRSCFKHRLHPMPPAHCRPPGPPPESLTPKALRGRILVKSKMHADHYKVPNLSGCFRNASLSLSPAAAPQSAQQSGPAVSEEDPWAAARPAAHTRQPPAVSREPVAESDQGSPRTGTISPSDSSNVDEEEADSSPPMSPGASAVIRRLSRVLPAVQPSPLHRDIHSKLEEEKTTVELSATTCLRSRKIKRENLGSDGLLHEIVSYQEQALLKLIDACEDRLIAANRRMLTRVYPSGTRVWSDNYSPVPAWNAGVQFVALNYQKLDFPMRLNEAKFEANGGCGYLVKPQVLRQPGMTWADLTESFCLRVKVISGSQIPKPNLSDVGGMVDPYVALMVSGLKEDCTGEPQKTRVIPSNGFDPLWNEDFEFTVRSVEMAMLTLRVSDNNSTGIDLPIAEASIPLTSLRCGYRSVPLRNIVDNVEIDHASLLCHFLLTRTEHA